MLIVLTDKKVVILINKTNMQHKEHQIRRIYRPSTLEVTAVYAIAITGVVIVGFCLALAFAPIVVQ